jgi:hypothetical protein
MSATAHNPPARPDDCRAHLELVAALVILGLRLAAGAPPTPVVTAGSTAVLPPVDDGCTLARPGQPC